jgi:chemotaxis protein methyltransferase CheR
MHLLRAAILCQLGDRAASEAACREVLARDPVNADAHYLLATLREAAGDADAAVAHNRQAGYLDPLFAMPHLHAGLMAQRTGDSRQARRALQRAARLLPREHPERIILFGGGFDREGLERLCQTMLDRLTVA